MANYYVTTPIYYVNDEPHLGHIYTTIAADVLARYKRLCGDDVFFLTGVDEHGQKVQQAAEKRGIEPIELANQVVARYESLWPELSITNDDFIRTSSERHKKGVQAMWRRLENAGTIYKDYYEDWYCVPCETYWTETQLKDADCWDSKHCPDCKREVEKIQEESYFFRLSAFQDRLVEHIKQNPDFIMPASRRNEVLSFVESGLRDLSVSRTTFSWGVPVPGDEKHVIYVWIDALTNYISALGFPDNEAPSHWPADVHLIGKDILRFHAVYWPAMLMAAELPLPKRVYAHGWWTVEGEKMSKSKGNALSPAELLADYDADVLRYFLLREVPFGHDGDFSFAALKQRYNTELANDVGNLLNRSLAMLNKYSDGVLGEAGEETESDRALIADIEAMQRDVSDAMDRQAFHLALERISVVVRHGNRYVEENAPWALAKEGNEVRLNSVLYHLVETLRLVALQLLPFMPGKMAQMLVQINGGEVAVDTISYAKQGGWGVLRAGHKCAKPSPIFPRME
ncbi:methionyl-tRNA synthetase [Mariprofundus ferrinatatus]|uniref:Methionine--tRNA ligase n=1 Tax=Mariprofundus ferrinatatus TaxID=1921087 RepID=A0A2K8L758_9PROT|nr:methionine--tRNA ligase [Mariprofundus ferrinatatus]ATX82089.1 methionyl-tRNA synthetase [Mariprofundus ferrinatatus]